ncbi:MAG TPA: BatD family protein, partial [Opitutaceae bacterium]|nr:BatD family protein [Opitutaceae bacterium]
MLSSLRKSFILSLRLCAALLFVLCAAQGLLRAQTARWHPDRGSLGVGQTTELQLVLEGCSPTGTPSLPALTGTVLELSGTSQSTQVINGSVTRRVILNYLVRPSQRGSLQIPAFDITTDRGAVTVPSVTYEVGEATVGQSGTSLDSIVYSRLHLPAQGVWAGEVFPLQYTLSLARRFSPNLGGPVEWNPAPLTVEEWGKMETIDMMKGGESWLEATHRSRASVRTPGTFTLKPAQQLVNLQTGTSMFGVFARPTMEQYAITSLAPSLTVKPLPGGAPTEFNGAVGEFVLTSKVIPTTAAVGEPVTWTLELAGTGNWPDISGLPSRQASRDFRVVQPQPKRIPKEGTLFDATFTEDVVLIPTRPGTYTVGPYRWSYFDPKSGQYRTIQTERTEIVVTGPVASSTSPTGTPVANGENAAPSGTSAASNVLPPPARPAALPQLIPGEPLASTTSTAVPLSRLAMIIGATSAGAALLIAWFALALRRARQRDPRRAEREARTRLLLTLKGISQTQDAGQLRTLLRAWQRDVLLLLRVPHASPSQPLLSKTLEARGNQDVDTWMDLWRETDRALYSGTSQLPPNWGERARGAIERQRVPAFSALSLFKPQNLLPFVALVTLLLSLPSLHGASALESYAKGDFSAAQSAFRERLASNPTDWIAHHNLALALGQQDRWGEAAAHASAAFVQQPNNEKVRWTWTLALQRAGYTPPILGSFLTPNPLHRIAQVLSPAKWSYATVLSAWLAAGG